jgi:hypothetical protein
MRQTTRHQDHVPTDQLLDRAIHKIGRYQMGRGLTSPTMLMNQTRLTVALLQEIKQAYITFPPNVRAALEEFLHG